MSSNKIKIGLLGCGRAAELIYLPALKKFPDIEVAGVADPIRERRELLSEKFNNCRQYSSLTSEFIEQIDAAIISTPPDTHVNLSVKLLRNDKYVLVEKPLALSMNGIQELADTESSSKASLVIGFNHRYWQPAVSLKEKLKQDAKISSVKITFTGDYSRWNPVSFKSDPLNDLGPHVFDLIRFIFGGEIFSVSAVSSDNNSVEINIKITGNVPVHCFMAHSGRTVKTINTTGEAGNYFLDGSSERIYPENGGKRKFLDLTDRIRRKILRRTSPVKRSYELQIKNFLKLIKSGCSDGPGIMEGIAAIHAVEAAQTSIKNNGKEILLNEIR